MNYTSIPYRVMQKLVRLLYVISPSLFVGAIAAALLWPPEGGQILSRRWPEMLTMLFASTIAGATSEGGGAVAFPVFTKVLQVSPQESRIFVLGIQTFGMGAASITILLRRINVNWRVLSISAFVGSVGMAAGSMFLDVSASEIRILFSATQAALGIFLISTLFIRGRYIEKNPDPLEGCFLVVGSLLGGVLSSIIGTGADIIIFSVYVILCRYSPKSITPTTVVLQWFLSLVGFAMHLFVIQGVPLETMERLQACIPVVLTFGSIGAIIAHSLLSDFSLTIVVILIIAAEVTSTIFLVPFRGATTLPACLLLGAVAVCFAGDRRARSRIRETGRRRENYHE